MTAFQYCAYGPDGKLAEGVIDAASADAASDLLWDQGLSAFKVHPTRNTQEKWWQREVLGSRKPSRQALPAFTRELATLMTAGIPLDDVLRILSEPTASAEIARIAAELRADVLNGATLSDAMERRPQIFPADYLSVIRAGEIGGMVGEVIGELADLLDRRSEMRSRVRSALIYPALLICLAVVSLAVIVGALVPSIATVFAGSGHPPPPFIAAVLALQANWSEIVVAIALGGGAAALLGWSALRKPRVRFAVHSLLLRLPVIGAFIVQRETARFARTLGTLLKAGVPLLQASVSAHGVLGNLRIAAQVDSAVDAVRGGAALNQALQRETVLPPIALRMISIGEEAGKLDRMLLRVAVMFEQLMQRTIDRAMTLLTPALTLVMAGFVGFLIIAVMNAIMSMNGLAF
jgi:general secretion pathway protein F